MISIRGDGGLVVYIIIANYALLISTELTIQSSILTLSEETLSPPIETCLLSTVSGGDVVDMSLLLF